MEYTLGVSVKVFPEDSLSADSVLPLAGGKEAIKGKKGERLLFQVSLPACFLAVVS
jgi:hypothetical protein